MRAVDAGRRARQGGWAVASTMIAIVIGLIMLSGIFALVNQALSGANINEEKQNLSAIRMELSNLYAGQQNYSGLDNDTALNAGVFPANMVDAGNVINAWNGDVTVAESADTTEFDITYDGVPQEECIELATFGQGQWEAVTVGGADIGDVTDAAGACSGDDNTLVFTSG